MFNKNDSPSFSDAIFIAYIAGPAMLSQTPLGAMFVGFCYGALIVVNLVALIVCPGSFIIGCYVSEMCRFEVIIGTVVISYEFLFSMFIFCTYEYELREKIIGFLAGLGIWLGGIISYWVMNYLVVMELNWAYVSLAVGMPASIITCALLYLNKRRYKF